VSNRPRESHLGRALQLTLPWAIGTVGTQGACKPDSVPRRIRATVIHLALALPPGSCSQPGDSAGHRCPAIAGTCPPIRPCSRWGLPASHVTTGPGALLPHRFTLACVPQRIAGPSAVWSLWHCRRLTAPGRYPAPRPVESGLSSPTESGRPSGPLSSTAIIRQGTARGCPAAAPVLDKPSWTGQTGSKKKGDTVVV
jgi:hypothetical protein